MKLGRVRTFTVIGASTLAIAACSLAIWFFSIAYVGGHLVGFELEKSEVLNGLKLSIFTG